MQQRSSAVHDDEEITVFLVDDHELVRRGLRELLTREPDLRVVGECGSAVDAIAMIPAVAPRVLVLDWRLADGTGLAVCRSVRVTAPTTDVLVLSAYDDAVFAAIDAGATGYVLKGVCGHELVDAIRRVGRGQSFLDPAVTAPVLARLRESGRAAATSVTLTEKERQVLDLIARGLTNRQIATQLGVAEKTVKNRVSLLLAKLGVETRTQAALLAADTGITRPDGAA